MKMTILIVDDDDCIHEYYLSALPTREFNVLQARTLNEARRLCAEHGDKIALVVVDGSVESELRALDTLPLVKEMREALGERPILAASSVPTFEMAMVKEGCSIAAGGKEGVPEKIMQILCV